MGPEQAVAADTHPRRWAVAALAAAAVALAVAVNLNGLGGEFILDDHDVVVNQPRIRSLGGAASLFATVDIVDRGSLPAGSAWVNPYYRPVFLLTFAADYALHGLAPAGYHATNVALHALATLLLFLLARRLGGGPAAAFGAAALFAVHPAHAEAITWIGARCHLLGAVFMLGSTLAWLAWEEGGRRRHLAASAALWALGLLSHEMTAVLPALLALHAWLAGRRGRLAGLWPFAALLVAWIAVRVTVMGAALKAVRTLTWPERFLSAPWFLARYVRDALLPTDLQLAYRVRPVSSAGDPRFVAGLAVAVAALALGAFLWRRKPTAAFALAWFLACIATALNVVQEVQPFYMAARYLYMPSIGLALGFGIALAWLAGRHPGLPWAAAPLALAAAVVAPLAPLSWDLNRRYLVDTEVKAVMLPRDPVHELLLAATHMQRGELARAREILEAVLEASPDSTDAWLALAEVHGRLGAPEEAEAAYRGAIARGRQRAPKEAAYVNLGVILARRGDRQEAISLFREAIGIRDSAAARQNLAQVYGELGMAAEAAREAEAARRLR